VAWMRCASVSLRLLSVNTPLRGHDNQHLLDPSRLLPLGPRIALKNDLPLSLPRPYLYKGIDRSPPPQPKKLCGTSSPSIPARDFAVPSHRVLSLLLSFTRSGFSLLSLVWVASVRPAVVLFYNLAYWCYGLICSPPVLCRTMALTNIIYIS
jgi:hypothetical protein